MVCNERLIASAVVIIVLLLNLRKDIPVYVALDTVAILKLSK
jgi:hypothetical protein